MTQQESLEISVEPIRVEEQVENIESLATEVIESKLDFDDQLFNEFQTESQFDILIEAESNVIIEQEISELAEEPVEELLIPVEES